MYVNHLQTIGYRIIWLVYYVIELFIMIPVLLFENLIFWIHKNELYFCGFNIFILGHKITIINCIKIKFNLYLIYLFSFIKA